LTFRDQPVYTGRSVTTRKAYLTAGYWYWFKHPV